MIWTICLIAAIVGTIWMFRLCVQLDRYNREIREWGTCSWLSCSNPGDGGEWTEGVRYCRPHMATLTYGLEDPL